MSHADSQIILVRHGPTTHPTRGWMNAREVERWLRDYEHSELRPGATPPDTLKKLAHDAHAIVASDAPRARMSATAIVGDAPVAVSPLLRELPMDIPNLGRVRLPLLGWAIVLSVNAKLRGRWTDTRGESLSAQLNGATDYLVTAAEGPSSVLAVVHANIRVELARTLEARGWSLQHQSHRYAHWSTWHFARSAS